MLAMHTTGDPSVLYIFPLLWISISTFLSLLSGWFSLVRTFPNKNEKALLTLKFVSGHIGLVNYKSILRISACDSGLRVGVSRLFGPFCNDFFVPWEKILIVRKNYFLTKGALFVFGSPKVGQLGISSLAADRLARAVPDVWPEGSIPLKSKKDIFTEILKEWLVLVLIISIFLCFIFFKNPARHPSDLLIPLAAIITLVTLPFAYRFWVYTSDL